MTVWTVVWSVGLVHSSAGESELERLRCELSTPGQDLQLETGGDKKVKKWMQISSRDLDPLSMIVA
jgi:hypothetical protein